MTVYISKEWTFDAAHRLVREDWSDDKNEKVFGKCFNEHGHTYYLEVTVTGEVDEETGMVLNYFDLAKVVKPIVDRLDHSNLNDIFDCLTTAENMVSRVAALVEEELSARFDTIFLAQIVMRETPKTRAVWRSETV